MESKENIEKCKEELQDHFDSTGKWWKNNILCDRHYENFIVIRRDYFWYVKIEDRYDLDIKWTEDNESRLKYDEYLFEVITPILNKYNIGSVIISDNGIKGDSSFIYRRNLNGNKLIKTGYWSK